MPLYHYTAKSQDNKEISGTIEAINEGELARTLRADGFILTSVKTKEQAKSMDINRWLDKLQRVSITDRLHFTQNLSVMLKAGLTLTRSLDILAKQTTNPYFKNVLIEIRSDIEKGSTFADALKKHERIFSELFINMIAVGEVAGNLQEILKLLGDQLKKTHELISKIRGAMIYPAVIFVAMIGIGVAMMIFVIPKLLNVFEQFDATLPITTRILIAVSNLMVNNLLLLGFIVLGIAIVIYILYRKKIGQKYIHLILLKLPIFGRITKLINSARFARTLSSLMSSGISIVEALNIISRTLTNVHYKKSLEEAAQKVKQGVPLGQALAPYEGNVYPVLIIQMINVGEETGSLSEILKRLAIFYEEEVDQVSKNLSSIVEPVLLLIVGGAVAFFALSIVSPIYNLANTI